MKDSEHDDDDPDRGEPVSPVEAVVDDARHDISDALRRIAAAMHDIAEAEREIAAALRESRNETDGGNDQ